MNKHAHVCISMKNKNTLYSPWKSQKTKKRKPHTHVTYSFCDEHFGKQNLNSNKQENKLSILYFIDF